VKHTRRIQGIKAFGQHLRAVRKLKGMTLEELAGRSDLEYSQVSRIERGLINTSLSQILVIAEALEIHPRELLDFEQEAG
jgi:transcriptional regulator with XRE-family HTH domain